MSLVTYFDSAYRTLDSRLHQLLRQRPHLLPPTYREWGVLNTAAITFGPLSAVLLQLHPPAIVVFDIMGFPTLSKLVEYIGLRSNLTYW